MGHIGMISPCNINLIMQYRIKERERKKQEIVVKYDKVVKDALNMFNLQTKSEGSVDGNFDIRGKIIKPFMVFRLLIPLSIRSLCCLVCLIKFTKVQLLL